MATTELIDTHCHLYLEEFRNDLTEIMRRSDEQGVSRIYLPSIDNHHFSDLLGLESRFPGKCFSMTGLHPCYVKENYEEELEGVRKSLTERSFAAIGEIGLDYYWDRNFDNYQMICFVEQLKMAQEYALPVVIHSRSSMEDCIAVLKRERWEGMRGIFHCFSGTVENALDIINLGMLLGIGGVVTYKNAGLAEVVAQLPLEKMVLETDAPYLTPVPFRGKRNESSYLGYIAARVAELKNVPVSEVAAATTANALAVFNAY